MFLKIKEWLLATKPEPDRLEKLLAVLYDLYYFMRVQKPVAALGGPMYERSRHFIELDITYACNLKCFNCNRSCGHAPSDDHLSLEQVRKFTQESIAKKVQWKRIRLLGGEPTLHPHFFDIVEEIRTFRKSHCPEARIEVTTNGLGKRVNDALARLPQDVFANNTAKKSRDNLFHAFNLAPKDFARYRHADFSCGCWGPEFCGFNLSPYGYYCCGAGAAIDRVFGFDLGRQSLPDPSDSLRDHMGVFCGYCGHFMTTERKLIKTDLMSESWRKGYEAYKTAKPRMTLY
jgi:hypothetical protein